MPPIAGNLILTITHDSPATFIFPALRLRASKRFSQFINDRKAVECEKLLLILQANF